MKENQVAIFYYCPVTKFDFDLRFNSRNGLYEFLLNLPMSLLSNFYCLS